MPPPKSHITRYMDITAMKSRCNESKRGRKTSCPLEYETTIPVDSIVCLDGMEVVGTYLAEALTRVGVMSFNAHKSLYVLSPEYSTAGQIIFRDNIQMAIRDKHILVLMGSVTTGKTLETTLSASVTTGAWDPGPAGLPYDRLTRSIWDTRSSIRTMSRGFASYPRANARSTRRARRSTRS